MEEAVWGHRDRGGRSSGDVFVIGDVVVSMSGSEVVQGAMSMLCGDDTSFSRPSWD
jgi:hypothetical protein